MAYPPQADGPCLCYLENLGLHPTVTYEFVVDTLLRAMNPSQCFPYNWDYIDKPSGPFSCH
jgi:hypothetical protein